MKHVHRARRVVAVSGLKLLMSDDHAAISDKMKQFKARSQEVTIDG